MVNSLRQKAANYILSSGIDAAILKTLEQSSANWHACHFYKIKN